jgi:ADP-ribosyl-[dinitrogen reductase] hydrolase
MDIQTRYRGALLGLAAGDAVGTTVEFMPRGSFPLVTDMRGGGPFNLRAGEWTDDTSMALCMAHSLVAQGGFDARDQMERYWRWYREGYMSSNGRCFDIGNATGAALHRYQETDDPFAGSTDPSSSGNGGIMRLAPVVLFYHPDREAVLHYAGESSRTTHASAECIDAAHLLADVLSRALREASKPDVLNRSGPEMFQSASIRSIARGDYQHKSEAQIRGTGYVVRSLEAALWCFCQTDSFEQAILKAANLGDDADTTAAICGQVAGAFYGEEGIPSDWRDILVMRDEMRALADALRSKDPLKPQASPA